MSRKTLLLITGLILLTALLVTIAIWQRNIPKTQQLSTVNQTPTTPIPTAMQVPAHTLLSFSPSPLILAPTGKNEIQVIVNSQSNQISAIQLELTYNPEKLTNVTVSAPTAPSQPFFDKPNILLNRVDPTKGSITYAVGIAPTDTQKNGTGIVATISFTPKLFSGEQTTMSLLPNTIVTSLGISQSILEKTSNGIISMSSAPSQ